MLISTQETLIYKSISPEDIYCYTPGITVTFDGTLGRDFRLGRQGGKKKSMLLRSCIRKGQDG